jgi:hypothetical protein
MKAKTPRRLKSGQSLPVTLIALGSIALAANLAQAVSLVDNFSGGSGDPNGRVPVGLPGSWIGSTGYFGGTNNLTGTALETHSIAYLAFQYSTI